MHGVHIVGSNGHRQVGGLAVKSRERTRGSLRPILGVRRMMRPAIGMRPANKKTGDVLKSLQKIHTTRGLVQKEKKKKRSNLP